MPINYRDIFWWISSIDAFVVGIALALLNTPIILPTVIIGIMAFTLSFIWALYDKIKMNYKLVRILLTIEGKELKLFQK
ncbi:MAG: manganese efflux pump [Methanobacterium sp.]